MAKTNNTIDDCELIKLHKEPSDKGTLSVIESNNLIPFDIKRVYFTYDIPSGAKRGGHSHINQLELIVAASGSFEVVVDDGERKRTIFLNNPSQGLYVPTGIWRELKSFSAGSVILVMASDEFLESDYIRDYELYLRGE